MSANRRAFLSHGRAISEIGAVSAIGIVASVGFQLLVIRSLGPENFGLLAAFLAIINVVSLGSAALRSSVAVNAATALAAKSDIARAREERSERRDSSLVESIALSVLTTLIVIVLAPVLASALGADVNGVLITAAAIAPYFIFARAQGLLQGAGKFRAVVWWSTAAQVVQLVLSLIALGLGLSTGGVLAAMVGTVFLCTVGASVHARAVPTNRESRAFSRTTIVVLLMTLAFAWITSADVIFVRAGASSSTAGAYAAASVLIKTTLIVPATLSLYLLPRFVGRKNDLLAIRRATTATLLITFASGIVMYAAVVIASPLVVAVLFSAEYASSASLLPQLALMWIPWSMAQALLIRLTAVGSVASLIVLGCSIAVQAICAHVTLPNVELMIIVNTVVGLATLAALFFVHLGTSSPTSPHLSDGNLNDALAD